MDVISAPMEKDESFNLKDVFKSPSKSASKMFVNKKKTPIKLKNNQSAANVIFDNTHKESSDDLGVVNINLYN